MSATPERSISYVVAKPVSAYMDLDVLIMRGSMPTRDAARIMQRSDRNNIVVVDRQKKPVGIVTSANILDKVSDVNVNAEHTVLEDIMTSPLVTISNRASLQAALHAMRDNHVKKLPVVNKKGLVVGIIFQAKISRAIRDAIIIHPRLLSPPVKAVLGNLGFVLQFAGVLMLVPAVLATVLGDTVTATGIYLTTVLLLVTGFFLNSYGEKASLNMQQSSILVFASLFILILFGTIPYLYAIPYEVESPVERFANGFFSSAAGFTTGGVSLFDRPEDLPQSFTFYRSYTQLVGGMSFIYLVMTAFYPEDKLIAMRGFLTGRNLRMRELFGTITLIFMLYIVVMAVLLYLFGERNFIDDVSLAMSTVATGGFLPNSTILDDLQWYEHLVLMSGMILGALPFVLHYSLVKPQLAVPKLGKEVLAYFAMLAGGAMIFLAISGLEPLESVFYVISAGSTAGLQSASISGFNEASRAILVVLMFVGGCGFSTAGGIKVFRFVHMYDAIFVPFLRRLRQGKWIRRGGVKGTKKTSGNILKMDIKGDGRVDDKKLTGAVLKKSVMGQIGKAFDVRRDVVSTIAVVGLFPLIALAVAGHLAGVSDVPLDIAFFEAVGLITTGGLSVDVISVETDPATKIAMSFVMIFGRLEIIAILYIFLPRLAR